MIARVKGYPFKVVLPDNVSIERRQGLEVWGAEIIPSDAAGGSNGAMRKAQQLAKDHPDWWFPYQYGNPANPRAHYESTGPEIWQDCPEITHFVAGLGTAGTLMGVGHYLKERNPNIQLWAVEPPAGEMVDGLKNFDEGFVPPVFTDNDGADLLDRKKIVGPRESIIWTRRLTDVGVFAGISTGAAMAGCVKCAEEIDEGVIVTIAADGGWKYLSTGAWTGDLDQVVERAKKTIYF
jgi:cysteine synthase B